MANTDPQAIYWSENEIRPICNLIMQLKNRCEQYVASYNAQGLSTHFPAGTDIVEDQPESVGQAQFTNNDVITLLGNVNTIAGNIDAVDAVAEKIANLPLG